MKIPKRMPPAPTGRCEQCYELRSLSDMERVGDEWYCREHADNLRPTVSP